MVRKNVARIALAAFACVLLSAPAWAQQTPSGIAGVVRDTSGGALPGVTVEAASPALIEKVRSVVTDGEGRYNIVDLRPGTYTVTFSLPGFSTFKREGITLSIGFTATVNADMQVGALEETITVTGAAPLVDTQNARQQKVMTSDTLTALPTGQQSVVTVIALTPGMTGNASVGGSTGAYHSQQLKGAFHGKRGSHVKFDGMRIDNYAGSGDSAGYLFNNQTVEETALETGGAGAESGTPNVGINMIPKEGGNSFKYGANGMYTNRSMQSSNLNDYLIGRGLSIVPKVDRMYDAGFTIGGPIRQNKVWFFASIRRWGTKNQAANLFWNATQGTPFYTPDLSRPAFRDEKYSSNAGRVTWQASQHNKFNFFVDIKHDCICDTGGAGSALGAGANSAREAVLTWDLWPNGIIQGTWSAPLTSKLLLEAGADMVMFHWPGNVPEGVSPNDISILETSTNFRYNQAGGIYNPVRRVGDRFAERFAISYVTGSHNFKTGLQWDQGYSDTDNLPLGMSIAPGIGYRFNRGVPTTIDYSATPRHETYYQKAELGLYAQDQWTVRRLTLNYGLRFDYYNGYIPAVDRPAGEFVPAVHFDAIHGAPSWQDWNPRTGLAYDLFGNGKTAVKASFGRYVAMTGNGQVSQYHPLNTSVNAANRSWNDANKNFRPDCDLHNFAANGECGPISNTNFGKTDPNAVQFADDIRYGSGARPYTWDISTEVQHQISGNLSVTGGYYHNWDGGFDVTDNLKVGPENYSTYCITAPKDARLPGGGGYQVCGLADINPGQFGQVTNLNTKSNNYGDQQRYNDFVSFAVDTRFASGLRFAGGVDTGRTVEDNCYTIDSPGYTTATAPQSLTTVHGETFCHNVTPLAGQTQVKLNGSYPLPAGFIVSGTYQNVPGTVWGATYAATTAEIKPSLGRDLSGATRTANVPLIMPNETREPRRTQIDMRIAKSFNLGAQRRLNANFDIYNITNNAAILGMNTTFGSSWLVPQSILGGRLLQFSGNFTF